MATRTSAGTGDWSAVGTWDTGVPVDGDTFVIADGHTVTFDVDQSAFSTGLAGVNKIIGTLQFAGDQSTYMKVADLGQLVGPQTADGSDLTGRLIIGTDVDNGLSDSYTATIEFLGATQNIRRIQNGDISQGNWLDVQIYQNERYSSIQRARRFLNAGVNTTNDTIQTSDSLGALPTTEVGDEIMICTGQRWNQKTTVSAIDSTDPDNPVYTCGTEHGSLNARYSINSDEGMFIIDLNSNVHIIGNGSGATGSGDFLSGGLVGARIYCKITNFFTVFDSNTGTNGSTHCNGNVFGGVHYENRRQYNNGSDCSFIGTFISGSQDGLYANASGDYSHFGNAFKGHHLGGPTSCIYGHNALIATPTSISGAGSLSIDGLIHGILEFFSDPPQDTILYTKIGANLKCFNIAAPDTGVLNKGSVTYIEGATFTGCANLTQYVSGGDVPQIIRLKDVTFTAGIDTNDWDITAVSVSLAAPSVAIIGHNITLSTGSTYEYIGDFGGTLNSDGYGLVRTETLSGGAASSPPGGATTAQKFIAYSGASPIWYEKRIFAEAGDVITVSASVYLEDSFTTHEPRIEFQRAEYGDEVLFSSRVSSETLSEETPAEATSTTGSWQTILQSHTVVEAGEYRAKVSAWAEIDNGLVKAFTAGNEKIAWVIPTISRSSGGGGVVSSIVSNILE